MLSLYPEYFVLSKIFGILGYSLAVLFSLCAASFCRLYYDGDYATGLGCNPAVKTDSVLVSDYIIRVGHILYNCVSLHISTFLPFVYCLI